MKMPQLKMEIQQEKPLPIGCGISERKEMQSLDFVDQLIPQAKTEKLNFTCTQADLTSNRLYNVNKFKFEIMHS